MATGLSIGVLGVLLTVLGNPRNSGICVSCFLEQTAGALGLHGETRMMYIRPEIIGFFLGAWFFSMARGDFRARTGSSPMIRFFLGFFLIVGCSVFIGCPIKMALRISAGDLTAVVGAAGLCLGVWIGVLYLKGGFTLGRSVESHPLGGLIMPVIMLLLLLALWIKPAFIGESLTGPGSMHPAWYYSLAFGTVIGGLAQRSKFCVSGGIRNFALTGDPFMLSGLLVLLVSALAMSLVFGYFSPGMVDQPGAHPAHLWNFLGLFLVGFGSVLLDACPFRQLVLSGEGSLDAGLTLLGMLAAGGLVYGWDLRSTSAGPTINGKIAVIVGLIFCFLVANAYRRGDEG
jgi:YedE family putative selenium metabolism protein